MDVSEFRKARGSPYQKKCIVIFLANDHLVLLYSLDILPEGHSLGQQITVSPSICVCGPWLNSSCNIEVEDVSRDGKQSIQWQIGNILKIGISLMISSTSSMWRYLLFAMICCGREGSRLISPSRHSTASTRNCNKTSPRMRQNHGLNTSVCHDLTSSILELKSLERLGF